MDLWKKLSKNHLLHNIAKEILSQYADGFFVTKAHEEEKPFVPIGTLCLQ